MLTRIIISLFATIPVAISFTGAHAASVDDDFYNDSNKKHYMTRGRIGLSFPRIRRSPPEDGSAPNRLAETDQP